MTREEMTKVLGFAEWASTPESRQFLRMLARVVDTEVGASGYDMRHAHLAHVNLGIQDAVRRVCRIVEDPLRVDTSLPPLPRATYQVDNTTP